MTSPQQALTTSRRRQTGPSLWLSVAILALGVAVASGGFSVAASRFVQMIDGPVVAVPGVFRWHLETGTWLISQRTGTTVNAGSLNYTKNNIPTIVPGQVYVLGPGGQQLFDTPTTFSFTITRGSAIYTGAVEFVVRTPGIYTVSIQSSRAGQITITPSLGQIVDNIIWFATAGVAGILVGIFGLILLIVGIVRRGRANRPPPHPDPSGYYPGQAPHPPVLPAVLVPEQAEPWLPPPDLLPTGQPLPPGCAPAPPRYN